MSVYKPAAWGFAAALYFVVTTFAHLKFSLWLVRERTTQWGGQVFEYSYRDFLPFALPACGLLMLVWLIQSARRHGARQRITVVLIYWLLWVACVAAVDRWLTFSVPEYLHYPQYALLTWMLAKTWDPDRTRWPVGRLLATTTFLGGLDEMAQYLWITVSYSHYYDFNDVLVNLLAAALGVMVYYGFRFPPHVAARLTPWPWAGGAAAFALVLVLAISGQHLRLTPEGPVPPGGIMQIEGKYTLYLQRQAALYDRWHPAAWRPRHWVLGPQTGLGLTMLIWLAWGAFGRTARSKY